jgi:hypothetical protein
MLNYVLVYLWLGGFQAMNEQLQSEFQWLDFIVAMS